MNSEFPVRSYGKSELALLYFPHTDNPKVAVNHLMAWIRRCTPLMDDLTASGYKRSDKFFSSRHVKMIVDHIGEP